MGTHLKGHSGKCCLQRKEKKNNVSCAHAYFLRVTVESYQMNM